ncbi:DUF2933 domain-containing protein [Thermoactinospora rubra]|uniref:DUF2933 domain-containing protein n=1 Tax=Thermoactinospora rubra TaxID=1088767 RepID=UPI000A0FD0DE|nr:DUF2933 domain-containing protein [Thermoactinospora rubra]
MVKQHMALAAVAVVIAGVAVAAGAPFGTVLLVVLLLGCPLMMLMMMRGMGGHGTGPSDESDEADEAAQRITKRTDES